jgi:hypothetical protein
MAKKSSTKKRPRKKSASKSSRASKKKAAPKRARAAKKAKRQKPRIVDEIGDLDLESGSSVGPRIAMKRRKRRKSRFA